MSIKKTKWELPFYIKTQQQENWKKTIIDQNRIELIETGIQENGENELQWESLILNVKPDYGFHHTASYATNFRCTCFEHEIPGGAAFICIDLLSGQAYYSEEEMVAGAGWMDIAYSQEPINWQDFLDIAQSISNEVYEYYKGINDQNWKNYLKAQMVWFRLYVH